MLVCERSEVLSAGLQRGGEQVARRAKSLREGEWGHVAERRGGAAAPRTRAIFARSGDKCHPRSVRTVRMGGMGDV